ncbi:MAG: phosphoribosylformylglycinamidine synthase subunit PurL [Chloroflexi bacterium]|nr:phosphoribosylformylglycinamidine synthase subunit PurL [Chloroflexota bacterium]MYE41943.1 phosphoribosylformylglycinamidine synthase subunit PurL [Chloroflexota bacterium]
MPVSQEVLDEIALTRAEYDLIVERLSREPNAVELGMFGALWSEHCGYKHSRPLLRMFSHTSPVVLSETGAENAGAVDIGDGLAVVFKVESHNHPSAVEPFQGAATGVGGIVRDILAMGARPIALLNSLRFGPLEDSAQGSVNKHLFGGVVRGISWYGNCIGVPDVGGEIYFDPSYSHNPLVNAMCVGLIETERLASAAARVPGSVLLLAGADTGRDGIHGASGLASRTFEEEAELRPTVQVGNPFLEKVLIEACLEALDTGAVLAIQDLGAAGLTSASIESAARAGRGVRIDLSQVHRRETGMSAYEVMLSESQERMLLVTLPERVAEVKAVFERWDVECREIGQVIAEPEAQIFDGSEPVAHLPIRPLSEAPAYRLEGQPSEEDLVRRDMPLADIPLPECGPAETLLRLLASPNVASKRAVYRQYDHQVQTNTVAGPGGSDAAVLRVKGTDKAITVAVDGNGRHCFLDPYVGGQIAVAEVCRNLSCTGARPLALTDCLNFGNPLRPDIYYQLEECIRGMALASETFDAPVVSGNVSLFNETQGQAVHPTPVVGALGLIEDATKTVGAGFPSEGLAVALLGPGLDAATEQDLAGSEYLQVMHGLTAGQPSIDLDLERRVQEVCRQAIADGLIRSAHDCSDGGLAVAVAESCILGGVGFRGVLDAARWDAALFGEKQSRIVISLDSADLPKLADLARSRGVPLLWLGRTGSDRLVLRVGDEATNDGSNGGPPAIDLPVERISEVWTQSLEAASG